MWHPSATQALPSSDCEIHQFLTWPYTDTSEMANNRKYFICAVTDIAISRNHLAYTAL